MALEIKSTPADYASAHGDLIHVVYDEEKIIDPVTYPDYKYVCDIYVGTELVARLKKVPHPETGMGIFNIGPIVRSCLSTSFSPSDFLLAQQLGVGNFLIGVTLEYRQEYNSSLSEVVLADVERFYFNHYNGRSVGVDTILPSVIGKCATVRPQVNSVLMDSGRSFLPFLPGDSSMLVEVRAYSAPGSLIGSESVAISTSSIRTIGGVSSGDLQILDVSPAGINSQFPGLISEGVSHYSVEVDNASVYLFEVECEPKYTPYTLHFLNQFGGFESFNFIKLSRETMNVNKRDFSKLPYTVNEAGQVGYYNNNQVYHEVRSVYSSQYEERVTINSDLLTDEQYRWLGQLVTSPMVYLEQDGYYLPVSILASDYEYRKRVNDKLTNLTLEIEFGGTLNTQFR